MEPILTRYAVRDLDGTVLFPAGTMLTREVLHERLAAWPVPRRERERLLDQEHVRADMQDYCRTEPFDRVFGGGAGLEAVLERMNGVRLPGAVLDGLQHFRAVDVQTYRHSLIVYALSVRMGMALQLPAEEMRCLLEAGPTHDFGKASIDRKVLEKRGPLTREERLHLGHHATAGYVLMAYYYGDTDAPAARIACEHHERKDGSGYVRGVPLSERLVELAAVADIFDALLSPRPYRDGPYDTRGALDELIGLAQRGKFSWPPVQAIVALNRAGHPDPRGLALSRRRRGTPPAENSYGILSGS